MTELIALLVIVVAVILAVAGIADARAQRLLDDQAAREGSRRRHPSYVRKVPRRRAYDWDRD